MASIQSAMMAVKCLVGRGDAQVVAWVQALASASLRSLRTRRSGQLTRPPFSQMATEQAWMRRCVAFLPDEALDLWLPELSWLRGGSALLPVRRLD